MEEGQQPQEEEEDAARLWHDDDDAVAGEEAGIEGEEATVQGWEIEGRCRRQVIGAQGGPIHDLEDMTVVRDEAVQEAIGDANDGVRSNAGEPVLEMKS